MSDDGNDPNRPSLRTSLITDAVFVAFGMGFVSLAFWARWDDTRELMHPFPFFLLVGVPIIFFATRRFVRTLVAHLQSKRDGSQ